MSCSVLLQCSKQTAICSLTFTCHKYPVNRAMIDFLLFSSSTNKCAYMCILFISVSDSSVYTKTKTIFADTLQYPHLYDSKVFCILPFYEHHILSVFPASLAQDKANNNNPVLTELSKSDKGQRNLDTDSAK